MNGLQRIAAAFAVAQAEGRPALMPYFTLGYPDAPVSAAVVRAICRAGADLVELGVPFSDPLADGPTIQRSTQVALERGMSVAGCLALVGRLRGDGLAQPFLLMGYVNPILAYGVERFTADAAAVGADGFIVPDLPPEEAGDPSAPGFPLSFAALRACPERGEGAGSSVGDFAGQMPMPGAAPWDMKMCRKPPACACGAASGNPADCATGPFSGQALEAACRAHGLALVYLLAPTSTPERIALVAGRSTGFTYLVSQTGVTGARDQLPADLAAFVGRVRTVARTPLAVGFGISNAAQARAVGRIADGVIVGSALINTVAEAADGPAAAASFVAGLRTALERRAE